MHLDYYTQGASPNNDQLLHSIRAGEEEAFSYLFFKHYRQLYSYAYRVLYDTFEADECVQSVFCRLWDNRQKIEIHDSIRAYLYRSVYNKCITLIRQRKRMAKYDNEEMIDIYFSRIIQTPEADMKMIDSETRKIILEAIDTLPDKCKEIFIKCRIDGSSYAEVASGMGISVKTVENQINIANRKLRDSLNWLLSVLLFM